MITHDADNENISLKNQKTQMYSSLHWKSNVKQLNEIE